MTNTAKQIEIIPMDPESLEENKVELLERETRIERAQRNAYYEIGLDLKAIRDKKLYKVERETSVAGRYSFETFEEYVEGRWDMERRHADRLIEAASVAHKMRPIGLALPSRESHVRELLKLETDEDRAEAWQLVLDREETITAKIVEAEVAKYISAKDKKWLTLDEYEAMSDEEFERIANTRSKETFNKQDTTSIEWAQWSWNPVTGCRHDCPYCYARDIANRFYVQKFEPSIWPSRLCCPENTNVPDQAKQEITYKNVFTCSMADLFGRWVPSSWIDLVMHEVARNKQWNFLFLTKFPQRFSELDDLPKNAWLGTTVDCQARVDNAEKAFAKVKHGTKWLSVEPLLTPLRFKQLNLFDWLVIGGASKSLNTPAWTPPIDWIVDLHLQAREAGCRIYYKTNAGLSDSLRIKEFPWGKKPVERKLPEEMKYLGMKNQ